MDQLLLGEHLLNASPPTPAARALYLVASFTLAVCIWQLLVPRPAIPKNAPKAWGAYDWPVVGSALQFYSRRRDMVVEGHAGSKHGSFSFYVGKKHVVCLGGPAGRKTFYDSRVLNLSAGAVELLAGMPFSQDAQSQEGDWPRYFNKTLSSIIRQEMLAERVPALAHHVRVACDRLVAQGQGQPGVSPGWRVIEAFDTVYPLLFELLSRVAGATEVAEDRQLSQKLLSIYDKFESSNSTTGIIFPWLRLVTPSFILRMVLWAKIRATFARIVNERERTGRRVEDGLQCLLDQGANLRVIVKFQITAAWIGVQSTGTSGAWLLVILASNAEWRDRCRDEVDRAVAKHRFSPSQSASDVLDSLTLEHWESEFPLLDACLREVIRVAMPGTMFRKNTSGADVAIGDTGEVIPAGSYAVHLLDGVHMDPQIYPDPYKFDPARHHYLGGEAGSMTKDSTEAPHSYVGWGSGRHPCLGMRLAKLEVTIIAAYFMARFDFGLSDQHGNARDEMPSLPDRNEHTAGSRKPKVPAYLRCKPRV